MTEKLLPYYEDLDVPQGSSYRFQIQMYDGGGSRKDLSNIEGARGSINYSYTGRDSDAIDILVNVDAPPSKGIINCSMTDTQTSEFQRRRYLYDIVVDYNIDGHIVTERILEGKILVDMSITK
jgi:hypothetical protein